MRSNNFVKLIYSSYTNCRGIFTNKLNAEDLVPKQAREKPRSLFLFYVVQLDYATKSQELYKRARELFNKNKGFFNARNIVKKTDAELESLIQQYLKPRYINEAVTRFKTNSNLLLEKYDGDPRLIFSKSATAREALTAVRTFRGFGPKIGNFFVRTMINSFGYQYDDIDTILPPVDIHDVRIAYLMGYISSQEMTVKNISKTKNVWSKACKQANVSWLTVDKALWLLGSEGHPKTKEDILSLL